MALSTSSRCIFACLWQIYQDKTKNVLSGRICWKMWGLQGIFLYACQGSRQTMVSSFVPSAKKKKAGRLHETLKWWHSWWWFSCCICLYEEQGHQGTLQKVGLGQWESLVPQKMLIPPLCIKLCIMKQFVTVLDKESAAFKPFQNKLSGAKGQSRCLHRSTD